MLFRSQQAHAVCVIEWQNRIYVYDINRGSLPIDVGNANIDYRTDHKKLAKIIFPDKRIIDSAFLKD